MADGPLPEYERPPVAEVALGFAFQELSAFSTGHFGLLWERFRQSYPRVEDHPPMDVPREVPPNSDQRLRQPRVQVLSKPPRLRCWFLNSDGTQLIQVQVNAFFHNWRRNNTDGRYPHYQSVRESFVQEVAVFRQFVEALGLGEVKPTQCELTYVNHIQVSSGSAHAAISDVLAWATLHQPGAAQFLPPVEDGQVVLRYPIRDDSRFVGRLNVSVQPAYVNASGNEILSMTLTARGEPLGASADGVLDFLDMGHEWIVRGFTELTAPKMHELWGRSR